MVLFKKVFISSFLIFTLLFNSNKLLSQWSNPLLISGNLNGNSFDPNINSTVDGKILFVWTQYYDSNFIQTEIYFRELVDGNLSQSKSISSLGRGASRALIFPTMDGIYHAFWGERLINLFPYFITQVATDIFYSKRENGVWTDAKSIYHNSFDTTSYFGFQKDIKKDNQDRIHIVWDNWDDLGPCIKYIKYENMQWSAKTRIGNDGIYFTFAIENSGKMHLVYIAPASSGDVNSIFNSYSSDSGETWSKAFLVHKSGAYPSYEINTLVDKNNFKHIIWTKDINGDGNAETIYHSYSADGEHWSQPVDVANLKTGITIFPNILCDKSNKIHLVWTCSPDFSFPLSIYYFCWDGIAWSTPEKIIQNGRNSSICIDSSGILHMAYLRMPDPSGEPQRLMYTHTINPVVSVKNNSKISNLYRLEQNYPNPFNPSTVINYQLPTNSFVTLVVYDIMGREVKTLISGDQAAGPHTVTWNAEGISGGIYFYRLQAGQFIETKKLTLIK